MTLYDLTSITDERNASKTPELLVTKNYSAGTFFFFFFFLLNSVLKSDHNVAKVTPEFEPAECSTILSSVRFKYVAYF